jgi:hypothetical protein
MRANVAPARPQIEEGDNQQPPASNGQIEEEKPDGRTRRFKGVRRNK